MKKTCIQCGKEFELSDSEITFYRNKKLELPKRCKECRQKNKRSSSVQSSGKYHYDVIDDRNNKITTGDTNKRRHSSRIIIGSIVLLIFLLIAGKYAGQFFHENRGSENQVQSQTDTYDQRAVSQAQADINDQKSETQSRSDLSDQKTECQFQFRSDDYLTEHFEKHGSELGYTTKEDYLTGANKVIASSDSLHKQEAEDGDDIYFLKSTGELVIVSTDGYIRTYFKPEDGIEYFSRQ